MEKAYVLLLNLKFCNIESTKPFADDELNFGDRKMGGKSEKLFWISLFTYHIY
jgi:hypothetical protein